MKLTPEITENDRHYLRQKAEKITKNRYTFRFSQAECSKLIDILKTIRTLQRLKDFYKNE